MELRAKLKGNLSSWLIQLWPSSELTWIDFVPIEKLELGRGLFCNKNKLPGSKIGILRKL